MGTGEKPGQRGHGERGGEAGGWVPGQGTWMTRWCTGTQGPLGSKERRCKVSLSGFIRVMTVPFAESGTPPNK